MNRFDPKLRESYVPLSGGVRSFLMGELRGSCLSVKFRDEAVAGLSDLISPRKIRSATRVPA